MSDMRVKGSPWWGAGRCGVVVRALAVKTGDHYGIEIFRLQRKDTGKPLGGFNRGWRRGRCFRSVRRKITPAAP